MHIELWLSVTSGTGPDPHTCPVTAGASVRASRHLRNSTHTHRCHSDHAYCDTTLCPHSWLHYFCNCVPFRSPHRPSPGQSTVSHMIGVLSVCTVGHETSLCFPGLSGLPLGLTWPIPHLSSRARAHQPGSQGVLHPFALCFVEPYWCFITMSRPTRSGHLHTLVRSSPRNAGWGLLFATCYE